MNLEKLRLGSNIAISFFQRLCAGTERKNKMQNKDAGSMIIYIIIVMVILSAMVAAVTKLQSTSSVGIAEPNCAQRARYMAEAGVRYAWVKGKENVSLNIDYIPDGNRPEDYFVFTEDAGQLVSEGYSCSDAHKSIPVQHIAGGSDDEAPNASDYVVSGQSDMDIPNQGKLEGSINSKGTVKLSNQSTLSRNIESGDDVEINNKAEVGGNIVSAGNVKLNNQTLVSGDIHASGDVVIDNGAVIEGNIYATGKITIANNAVIHGEIHAGGDVTFSSNGNVYGDIFSGGDVELNNHCTAHQDVNAAGDIKVNWGGTIGGNAVAGGNIDVNPSGGEIVGSAVSGSNSVLDPQEPQQYVALSSPSETDFTAGNSDVTDGILSPGQYGDLYIRNKKELRLSDGVYYFKSISTGNKPKLYFDLSEGNIELFIENDVTFGNQLTVFISSDGMTYSSMRNVDRQLELAAKIYCETHADWTLSNQNEWFGTIYASKNLTFDNENYFIGSYYYGETCSMGNAIEFIHVPSEYAAENW